MAAHTLSTPTRNPTRRFQPVYNRYGWTRKSLRSHSWHTSWLGSISVARLSLGTSSLRPFIPEHLPVKPTSSFSLPTANPERVASAPKVPKCSSKAIKSFAMAELEARKLKYPTTGTEALIMGILIEGTNFASKFLRANGITLWKVREETVKLLGKADLFYFSPEHPPLTEDAQRALDWVFDEKLKSGTSGEITTTHMLLGVWAQEASPGHKILATLGLNNEKVEELVSSISEPEFVDD